MCEDNLNYNGRQSGLPEEESQIPEPTENCIELHIDHENEEDSMVKSTAKATSVETPAVNLETIHMEVDSNETEGVTMGGKSEDESETSLLLPKLDGILQQVNMLQEEFQSKLKYDQHKERIIDSMHRELQEYKQDLLMKALNPIIIDVIQTIDDIRKAVIHYRCNDPSTADPAKLLDFLEKIPTADLEPLLYRQGVEPFVSEESTFDPGRQRVLKTVPVSDVSKDKTIAESLRPGYTWHGKVIRPEMVAVYVYKANQINDQGRETNE